MGPRPVAPTVARLYLFRMLQRTLPAGFTAPCLPTKTDKLPSGSQWLHEIKRDGFRIIARKTGAKVDGCSSLRCRGVLSFRWEARESLAVKRREFITLVGGAAAA